MAPHRTFAHPYPATGGYPCFTPSPLVSMRSCFKDRCFRVIAFSLRYAIVLGYNTLSMVLRARLISTFYTRTTAFFFHLALVWGCRGAERTADFYFLYTHGSFFLHLALVWGCRDAERTADFYFLYAHDSFFLTPRNSMGVWGYNTPTEWTF